MPYPLFDRSRLKIRPLAEREHDLTLDSFLHLDDPLPPFQNAALDQVAARIARARQNGRPVILMMGAHVIRSGVSRYLIDLMERGLLSHLALNGAGAIHDWELALIGATTESVARYIRDGQFGLWRETGQINEVIVRAAREGLGIGEAIGKTIAEGTPSIEGAFPYKEISVFAAAYRLGIPITVHVGVGYDILHEHPNCDGASLGATSYRDFLAFTQTVAQLEGGVFLNFGTAVMGPEVYLKALAMARNVAAQEGRQIAHFTTAVFDLHDLGDAQHERPKDDPLYYYRPFKTILVRTVQDGGESLYIRGPHRLTLPHLHQRIIKHLAGL